MNNFKAVVLAAISSLILSGLSGCGKVEATSEEEDKLTNTGKIVGRVLQKDGTGLQGARIITGEEGVQGVSGPDGYYIIPDVPAGKHNLTVQAYDYISEDGGEWELGLSDSVEADDVTLTYRYLETLTGTITNQNGNPIIKAGVAIEGQPKSTFSVSNGVYLFNKASKVSPGDLTVMYVGDNFYGIFTLNAEADESYTEDGVAELEGGILVGRIMVENARTAKSTRGIAPSDSVPLVGATISAMHGALSDVTDSAGYFILYGVPKGVELILKIIGPSEGGAPPDTMSLGGITLSINEEIRDLQVIIFRPALVRDGITLIGTDIFATLEDPKITLFVISFSVHDKPLINFDWIGPKVGESTDIGLLTIDNPGSGKYVYRVVASDSGREHVSDSAIINVIVQDEEVIYQDSVTLTSLSEINPSNGILIPPFHVDTLEYVIGDYTEDTISLDLASEIDGAVILVNEDSLTQASTTDVITLDESITRLPIIITREGVDSTVYTVTIIKDTLAPVITFTSIEEDTTQLAIDGGKYMNITGLVEDANFVTDLEFELTGAMTLPPKPIPIDYTEGTWIGSTPFSIESFFLDGVTNCIISATDVAGNTSTDTLLVTIEP